MKCDPTCSCGRHSTYAKQRIAAYQRGQTRSLETRTKMRDNQSHGPCSKCQGNNKCPSHTGTNRGSTWKLSTETRRRQSVAAAQRRARGDYNASPNKLELQVNALLQGPWQFTGDRGLAVGNRCPDFWDGGSRVIEVFGDYWHQDDDPQDWIRHYAQHGYTCFVVWEREVKAGQIDKLLEFSK